MYKAIFTLSLSISLSISLVTSMAFAETITTLNIAAASDLRFVMRKLIQKYQESHQEVRFNESYGSSGSFVSQIKNGAAIDLFFSADFHFAEDLVASHLTRGPAKKYARGILVLCGAERLEDLKHSKFRKIAIANPSHAPYGVIAIEAMKSAHIYQEIKAKLVFGENVSQAAEFILVGAVKAGLIAKSLSLSPNMKSENCHEVDTSLYKSLTQSLVVLKKSQNVVLAQDFAKFILSRDAQIIFAQNGFESADFN